MPSNTFSVSVIGRGVKPRGSNTDKKRPPRDKPQSAVACAAYRAGEKLYDARIKKTFDYSRREDALYSQILTPKDAPEWAQDRQAFWNQVEAFETRKDARLARSIIAGLHRELTFEHNLALVREFAEKHLVTKGMVVDFAIHESAASDGGSNCHVHMMLSVRKITSEGFVSVKGKELSEQNLIQEWRDAWEKLTNDALQKAGSAQQVCLKSYEKQGIDKTPQIHLGYAADNQEKMGIQTERGEHNRRVRHGNQVREAIAGLLSGNRRPGKVPGKPKHERLRSLGCVARAQSATEDDSPRSRAEDERAAWQKFRRSVMANFRDDVRTLDQRMMKMMMHSHKQGISRRHLEAAISRDTRLHSTKELSDDLNQNKDHER